jgi:hypothetical protein
MQDGASDEFVVLVRHLFAESRGPRPSLWDTADRSKFPFPEKIAEQEASPNKKAAVKPQHPKTTFPRP